MSDRHAGVGAGGTFGPTPAVRTMLEGLSGGLRSMILCNNGGLQYVNRVIDSQDIRQCFDVVRCRASNQDNKPAMVGEIMRKSRGSHGVVTDDRKDDVETARPNSQRSIDAGYGYGSEDELKDADVVPATASEIPGLVARVMNN